MIMKNFFRSIVCAIALVCFASSAHAQLGDTQNAIGVNFGYGVGNYDFNNFGLGIRYNRNLSEALRLDINGMYYFKSGYPSNFNTKDVETTGKGTDWFDVNLNAHYLFGLSEKVYLYPIFGLTTMFGYTNIKTDDDKFTDKHFRFGANLGMGGQYNITDDFGVTLEAKYKLVSSSNKFGHFNVALGCVVLF